MKLLMHVEELLLYGFPPLPIMLKAKALQKSGSHINSHTIYSANLRKCNLSFLPSGRKDICFPTVFVKKLIIRLQTL